MSAKLSGHVESPEISGLLYKKRGGFGKMMPNNWQYRFFILSKDGILTYYDTEVPDNKDIFEGRERGRLDLKGIKYDLATESTEGAPTPNIIIIQPEEGEKWKLCADTKEDHARWWRLIEKFIPEHSDRVTSRPGQLNVQSDDDYDAHSVASPSNSVAGAKHKKQPPSLGVRSADGDVRSVASIPNSPTNFESSFNSPITTSNTPYTHQPTPAVSTKKNRLRAAKTDGSFVSQEWVEWVMVMLIVNICVFAMVKDAFHADQAFYIIVLNAIVAHTLTLRAHRTAKAVQAAAEQSTNTLRVSTHSVSYTDKLTHTQVHTHTSAVTATTTSGTVVSPTSTSAAAAAGVVQASRSDSDNSLVPRGGASLNASNDTAPHLKAGKPLAGFTLQQVTTEPKLSPDHTWCKADFRQFNVRIGPDYNRHKKKAPSAAPIYEPFAVDVFCTKLRADHCSPRFQLLDPSSKAPINVDTGHPHVPPVFVIQIQIPSDPPSGFFTSAEDGPGWAIMMYYRITEDTLAQLKDFANASPAVKLFAEWCEKCTEDAAWRGRFKVINSCTNLDELGIPSAISSYNAKPILIRRTGSIFKGVNDGVKYMEMNLHVHKFATLAKQSIHYISSKCGQMYMQIGFVIEGREDNELPETMFACVAVNKPQEEKAEFIFDEEP